ncbi:MAG: hypothetical protein ABJN72_02130 [Sulfitobacter sp.]
MTDDNQHEYKVTPRIDPDEFVSTWVNAALPIIAAMGAIILILTKTLGSGSYLEFFPVGWKNPLEVILVYIIIIFLVAFSLIAMSYLTSTLKFQGRKREVLALSKARVIAWYAVIVTAFWFTFTVVFIITTDDDSERAAFVLMVLCTLLASAVASALIFHLVKEALAQDWITMVLSLMFFFAASVVILNVHRDAEKAAFVGDSEFCYWVSSKEGADNALAVCQALLNEGFIYQFHRMKLD